MVVADLPFLNPRYRLLDLLGEGGMGAVYRAYDRLTGETIALKHVAIAPDRLQFASRTDQQPALALAQEFEILASLRHPNIIAVRDYGFDPEHHPFFTMDLLENAPTVIEAGHAQPLEFKINLIQQMLLALMYLHRRGILHRDLKPGNVLVSNGVVKVLDFGLSIAIEQVEAVRVGSLAFMAPEVLAGRPATVASDLYAVGLIAYELLVGHHPYDVYDAKHLIAQILEQPPDLAGLDRPIATLLLRLLAKDPSERETDTTAAIRMLSAITGQNLLLETRDTRESFLQAAKFVGREAELKQLTDALSRVMTGHGSAWLIGGESGVGKSRLIDELSARALVNGYIVARGQAVEGGGLPYQIWRNPTRRLVLSTELSDLETAVLKEIVPDIGILFERDVPDAPELPGEASQQRLALTLTDLFKRQTQPFVLILEDLQWAAESLASLKLLTRSVGNLPLLVIGSYRDDERPALSAELPDAQTLKLSRLDESAVADLSAAMLGQTGRQSQVVELLTRETDGNTFFLVEVVRALAEEAGGLELIAHMSLPQRVLAGGIQAVLSRRLQRVPAWARPALNLAAVAGRQIDLKVMNAALGPLDWDAWLIVCADAAVIEVKEDRWRFAHDKLREAALSAIPEAERMAYHAQVATALETAYPASDALADNLMEHWRAAGDEAKELIYIPIVAKQIYNLGLNIPRARQLLEHGLDLATRLPNVDKLRMNLLKQLGDVCDWAGEFLASKNYYERSLALAEQLADDRGRAAALYGIGGSEWQTGDYAQAAQRLEESLQLAHTTGDRFQMAATLNLLGIMRSDQADYAAARSYKQQSLVLLRELGDQRGVTVCLLNLGNDARRLGDYTAALDYLTEGVTLARAINARRSISNGLAYLALVAQRQGNFADALAYISEGLAIDRENDDRYSLINDFVIRANIQLDLQAAEAARHDLHDGLRLAMEAGAKLDILFALIGIADLLMRTDQAEQASKLVGLIDAHPAFTAEMRQNHLQPLLHKLQAILSPGTLAAAMERGRYLDLDTVVQGSLSQLV